uniref:ribosomal protein L24 n=1 Tax=Cryptomonas gyropyrenoidosa TaxID=233257 RepID=UPI0027986023|nr:ribosomal protein L24 [Cryptomonas gyropyrenoidosa]WFQ83010.1 ribosomal protein L24 [Cryptomonas gyropyrenoidosa]
MTQLKFYLKTGDTVKVISGKDKGKISQILKVLRAESQVILKDINIKKKHVKPKKEGDVGRISQFEAPIHKSKVMLYSTENQIASRISIQVGLDGKKVRVLKKLSKI